MRQQIEFNIAIGRNRRDTRWRNETWTWTRLVEKLRNTTRTAETLADYFRSSKDRRGEIKDVGGFVGGFISGGNRKKGAVLYRQLVTLDIDYATGTEWDDATCLYDCAMLLYSTHSHTKEHPRYRLVIPLNREVGSDEYEAIARKIAGDIGIDKFDDSTYQPERLMYWASTAKNGEYVFESQEGDAMNADEILNTYRDWKDSSQWTISSRVSEIVRTAMKKQGEPTEKPGAVGRFCRAYTIHEAIEAYLSDVYERCEHDDSRYTYLQGSTAAGLITYDDKFAYSHHGTDPAGQKLCNAFDLVRIHKFGLRDEDARADTPINRMPSFTAMEEFVGNDERVKATKARETSERLRDDFADVSSALNTDNDVSNSILAVSHASSSSNADADYKWIEDLATDKKGNYLSTAGNIITILENAKGLKGNIKRNELLHADTITHDLPWRKAGRGAEKRWTDDDDCSLIVYMDTIYGITGKEKILTAKTAVMAKRTFHPVRDYLKKLHWDGTPRVDTLFIKYLGAEDTQLTRAVTRKALAAAVARAEKPGCKFDYITVLKGAEGIGKSTILSWLGGEWFNDSITDLSGKEGREQIQGSWIEEIGELVGVKRSDTESIKTFLSCRQDEFRPAYGRVKQVFPRQCVFFATTNEAEFLKGDTGNRRFWIIDCKLRATGSVWELTKETRDQVWAEAKQIYENGEDLYLDPIMETQMRELQSQVNETNNDPRIGMIETYLSKRLPLDWATRDVNSRIVYLADDEEQEANGCTTRNMVSAIEIYCEVFGGRRDDDNIIYKTRKINKMMSRIYGWEQTKTPRKQSLYGAQRVWIKTIQDEDEELL